MTAAQAALPLDNPFSAPSLPRLRGGPSPVVYPREVPC